MPSLLVLFNHTLTEQQLHDAENSLGITRFVEPPPSVRALWSSIPADAEALEPLLEPVRRWIDAAAVPGDHVLVQGDFGATYLMVNHCLERGLVPVYATTRRKATEELLPDGSVRLTHNFEHRRFRRYGL
ncbi:hypothetical protein SAMN02745206_01774 [Desulfacinum infernum DSM 9756]|uniref:Uncharacterized protein n=1 Tax=Desulfacinum infernum DSM 9756 TaxID=1121391 RepID=A0A1M5ASD9_9BACT|nr:CRISPR-associated protein Csx20 [Desulfacinum infernum]SHF33153.1 hypothetical protein SAMN02745206_01774 [Desulfacinum infernum DSM 9756]